MPSIKVKETKKEVEVPEGARLRDYCDELGIPVSCTDGICGTCMVDVLKGEENLSDLTQQELDLERDEFHRLACQCKVKKGNVELGLGY